MWCFYVGFTRAVLWQNLGRWPSLQGAWVWLSCCLCRHLLHSPDLLQLEEKQFLPWVFTCTNANTDIPDLNALALDFTFLYILHYWLCVYLYMAALKCPPGKEYKPCVNTCKTMTCQNRDYYEESTCSSIREECVCKSGTILHRADSAFCVTEDQCGEKWMKM